MKKTNEINFEKYEIVSVIGEGAYGKVYKVIHIQTGAIRAIKEIFLNSQDEGIPSNAIREISLLKELQNANVVKLFEVLHSENKYSLVFEYIESDLKKILEINGPEGLDLMSIKSYFYQLVKVIGFCHHKKVIHRDLKPQNILISKDGTLKLADFGLARVYGIPVKNYTHTVVTLWYRAPDILMGSTSYSTSIDIWSMGCILAELYNKIPLFQGTSESDQLDKIFQKRGFPSVEDWPEVKNLPLYKVNDQYIQPKSVHELSSKMDSDALDLLDKMLQLNPRKRISAKDALNHPYFKDIPDKLKYE